MTADEREVCAKYIKYRKDCMDRWEAWIVMGDGFVHSYTLCKGFQNGKRAIKERLLDRVEESSHPLPFKLVKKKIR